MLARGLIAPRPRSRTRRKDRLIARSDHARRILKFQKFRDLYISRTSDLKFHAFAVQILHLQLRLKFRAQSQI